MSQRGADNRLVLEVEGFERAAEIEEVAEGYRDGRAPRDQDAAAPVRIGS